MLISGPYFFTASTLLVRAFIPMTHGPNPGFHFRPNLSPQGQAQDHIPPPPSGDTPSQFRPKQVCRDILSFV